ncbi:PLP-dependent aminotransferase family protein [Lachnospiraceae bacterium 54-53]
MLIIDGNSREPLYLQLYRQIKADILSGRLKSGAKLQSSRRVSDELHISRNTVELAYDQLFAEGFITSIPRRGYYVEKTDVRKIRDWMPHEHQEPAAEAGEKIRYDFRCGRLLFSELPCAQWHRLTARCFRDFKDEMAMKKSPFGESGLRREIQRYIHNYRNVECTEEQIVVTTGTQFCLDIICRILRSMGGEDGMAMEEPGYDQSRITFENNGFQIRPVELDRQGAMAEPLKEMDCLAVYVTPSHQFPTGTVMSMARREEFAAWAREKDGYIIEDDYNCHYLHGLRPIPSLQSLCGENVFYIGSFSDILLPCINVSYMVVPEKLLDRLHRLMDNYAPFVPFLTQKPLELFMKEGYWESHLRKMRKRYKEKNEALLNALKDRFKDNITVRGHRGGSHVLVTVKWPVKESELVSRARRAGIGVYPTSNYWSRSGERKTAVLLNYGGIAREDIPEAVECLYRAWHDGGSGTIKDCDTGSFDSF